LGEPGRAGRMGDAIRGTAADRGRNRGRGIGGKIKTGGSCSEKGDTGEGSLAVNQGGDVEIQKK